MKKIKIGIPRALMYHKYSVLWKSFFTSLGCKVTISPETTTDIINLGKSNAFAECCLSYKIYLGHVIYLSKFCDYVLVAQICDNKKKNSHCPRLSGLYDYLNLLISKEEIIELNLWYNNYLYEFLNFIKIGLKFSKNPIKIIYSYIHGKIKQKKYDQEKNNEENNKLTKKEPKVLILSPFYNLCDKYVAGYIIDYLKKSNIIPILSNYLDRKKAILFSEFFSDIKYWQYSKETIGALQYYNHQIDGVIYLTVNNCSIDSIINNLAMHKNKHLQTINITIDSDTLNQELETKLAKFISIIKGVKDES